MLTFPPVAFDAQDQIGRQRLSARGCWAGATGLTPRASSTLPGTARLTWQTTWDYDNQLLTYKVFRDGGTTPVFTTTQNSSFWQLPSLSFTDTGLASGSTHSYVVRAYDPFGNTTGGAAVSVTVR